MFNNQEKHQGVSVMSYIHLTIFERESILKFKSQGHSIRSIAYHLNRSPSTISRELRRCKKDYSPYEADNDYHQKRAKCHKPSLLDQHQDLCVLVARLIIENHWSPQQIANRCSHEGYFTVSYATIYRHIKRHNLNRPFHSRGDTGIKRCLRHRGRKRHPKGVRRHKEAQVDYISIHERPNFINRRQRIGDWEIDTVLGKVGKGVLVTAVERKTRYTIIGFSEHKDSQHVNRTLLEMFRQIPKEFVLSLTPDHGREFLQLAQIRDQLGVTIYWPDPYSPEQRGTNENTNGLIREYFPKNQNISIEQIKDINYCQRQLNQRPKKILNYQTPEEVLFDKVLHLV